MPLDPSLITPAAETGAEWPVGEVRAVAGGEYELGAEIARGATSQRLEARDNRHDRDVIIKRPLAGDDGARLRFERELRLLARLQHHGIVPIYEAGVLPTGEPFVSMPRVEGRTL